MSIIDPGLTIFDDSGNAKMSPHAIRLPKPPELQASPIDISKLQPGGALSSISPLPPPPVVGETTKNFDTIISPSKENEYAAWKQKFAPKDTGQDYDLPGAFSSGQQSDARGHFTDEFKKPNHPTFSVESKYSTPENTGGRWVNNTFEASPANLKNRSIEDLQNYFRQNEPRTNLVLPKSDQPPVNYPIPQQELNATNRASLPQYSPANTQMSTDMMRDIIAKSLSPKDFPEPTGIHKFLNRIAGGLTGFSQGVRGEQVDPTFYNLQHAPYLRAQQERQQRLKELEPAVKLEEEQSKDKRLGEQAAAQLSATQSHQKAVEGLTAQEREIQRQREEEQERKDLSTENLRNEEIKRQRQKDEIQQHIAQTKQTSEDAYRNSELDIQRQRLKIEADRLNKEKGTQPGTWKVEIGKDGEPFLFNTKTTETKPVPSQGIISPQEAKTQADAKGVVNYADNYQKSGKYTGPGDVALLEQFFTLAKARRLTEKQLELLEFARNATQGVGARFKHLTNPDAPYFDDNQRRNIVETIKAIGSARGVEVKDPRKAEQPKGKIISVE